jgi:hypothetical protein
MELYRHFQTNKVPYLLSPSQPGWGSPIGNGLEHGTGPPAGDNFSMVKGLEVVLPNKPSEFSSSPFRYFALSQRLKPGATIFDRIKPRSRSSMDRASAF